MQKTRLLLTSLTFMGLIALAGCSFPGVYKIDIQQGNVVTQDMIDPVSYTHLTLPTTPYV